MNVVQHVRNVPATKIMLAIMFSWPRTRGNGYISEGNSRTAVIHFQHLDQLTSRTGHAAKAQLGR